MFANFYDGKKVLVTGHTGFKGSWLCFMLNRLGAKVYGYSLEPPTEPSLYKIAKIDKMMTSEIGDIRDYEHLKKFFDKVKPDVVFHLAAQPLVIEGYNNPRLTYETNVMGTVNILECVRNNKSVISFLNVTTDKVYENNDDDKIYVETDKLDGYDPYSNSKSCSEIVTHSYVKSFFKNGCKISTVRAGNVIGGGDFSDNRIIPDCVRAATSGNKVTLRNPNSTRPFQHVLEPLYAYLLIAYEQTVDPKKAGCYNIGPDENDIVTVGELTDIFCKEWGNNMTWVATNYNGPHEANYLKLDNNKIKRTFGYKPHLHIDDAVRMTVEWTKVWNSGKNVTKCMERQIEEYYGCD